MTDTIRVYDENNEEWIELPLIGPEGPAGPIGERGETGVIGEQGAPGQSIDGNAGPQGVAELNHLMLFQNSTGDKYDYGQSSAAAFGSAISDATNKDIIFIPTCYIEGNFTIPEGVTVIGKGVNSIIDGKVTLSNRAEIKNLSVVRVEDNEAEVNCITTVGDSDPDEVANMTNCLAYIENSGRAVAVIGGNCPLNSIESWAYGKSNADDGYAYRTPGNQKIYVSGGLAWGSTAPVDEEESVEPFPYIAWSSWVYDNLPVRNWGHVLRFSKREDEEWRTITVHDFGETSGEYFCVMAQNWGGTFLITAEEVFEYHSYVYRSVDYGETWEELSNNLSTTVRWLDCWNGTWVALLENGCIAKSTDGEVWTEETAHIPYEIDAEELGSSNVCLDNQGVIHVVRKYYGDDWAYYSKTENLGETWSSAVPVLDVSSTGEEVETPVAISANDGHVFVCGCYNDSYEVEGLAVVQVSHDNGDIWESLVEQPVTRLPGWGYSNVRGTSILCYSDYAYLLIDVEMSGPGQPEDFDKLMGYVECAIRFDYKNVGAPSLFVHGYTDYYLGSGFSSGAEGHISAGMSYGPHRAYGATFMNHVPVDINEERQPPWYRQLQFHEMRAYYVDTDSVKAETVWIGDYPGPSYSSARPSDRSYQNSDTWGMTRFAPWRE
jgi:hypothetical protein